MALSPRESAEFIASKSEQVTLHKEKVGVVVEKILPCAEKREGVFAPKKSEAGWREVSPPQDPEARLMWIFVSSACNFSFWTDESTGKFTKTYKGQKHSGYWSLCACFNDAIESGMDLLSPSFISQISRPDAQKLFAGDNGMTMPMLKERIEVLHEVGTVLIKDFNGSVAPIIQQAGQSVQNLVKILAEHLPCFRDVASYGGKEVSFYKRAQIMCADLYGAFDGQGYGAFHDYHTLTAFADYRIPQVLAYYGVLEYTPQLTKRLLNPEELLSPGEPAEVEIRGCSVHAVELITHAVNARLEQTAPEVNKVRPAEVDNFLWNLRREQAQEMARVPFHRIRTIFY